MAFDDLGVDSLWTWDHFFPLAEPMDGEHFEGWSILAAMAATTSRARVGMLVSGNAYRNPDLLADMARTVDHISGGRAYLGLGAGWIERDHEEYGYAFPSVAERLSRLESSLIRIRSRLSKLNPAPLGPLPVLVGGSGEKVTLRIVATYADAWNTFGPPEEIAHKMEVLKGWCDKIGRDPNTIEKTLLIRDRRDLACVPDYREIGVTHFIWWSGFPFRVDAVEELLALSASGI
jgi:probable F420-dependent oxidoreductase